MPIDRTSSTTTSQQLQIQVDADETVKSLGDKVNQALSAITADVQRSTSKQDQERSEWTTLPSSGYRLIIPYAGLVEAKVLSTVATTGSDGSNYHILSLYRNGVAANSVTQDTRYNELVTYRGGARIGTCNVSAGDVLSINLSTTGSPTSLTVSDLLIWCNLKRS